MSTGAAPQHPKSTPSSEHRQRILSQMRAEYAATLEAKMRDLREQLRGTESSARERARDLAHGMRGTGGAVGFHELSRAAAQLEDLIVGVLRGAEPDPEMQSAALERLAEAVEQAVAQSDDQ